MSAVREAMQTLTERVRQNLPDLTRMTDEQIAAVLLAYAKVIAPNFVHWMALVWLRTTSRIARAVCQNNLLCEISQDHPQWLNDFIAPLYIDKYGIAERAASRTGAKLTATVDEIHAWCYTGSVPGLVIMAILENSSLAFIPWMEQAADRLGLPREPYLKEHGIGDIEHAQAFCTAIEAELGTNSVVTVDSFLSAEETGHVMKLLDRIFHAYKQDESLAKLAA